MISCIYVFFFFSSRRRHTRYIGDWSSDVCSSDLDFICTSPVSVYRSDDGGDTWRRLPKVAPVERVKMKSFVCRVMRLTRSEERRVGKECRSRWWACDYKKKRQNMESDI